MVKTEFSKSWHDVRLRGSENKKQGSSKAKPATKEVKIMINAQILPTAFYGIQNFIDSLNAGNAKVESSFTPNAEYYEVENGFVLEVELPGVKKEDLDVQVEKDIITVKATRARKDEKITYERSFRLADDIDTDNIKAALENGVLKFELAKRTQAAARKIDIA